jgi:four helix bundle protein
MPLDHERLEVYQVALELFDVLDDVVEQLPRGRGHLADRLSRAALSIVNKIAEGAGKLSPGDNLADLTALGTRTGTEERARR